MTDALLSDNQRKAEISHAFLAALAARDGYSMQRGPDPDVDSIDATIRSGVPRREAIDVQLKATATPDEKEDGLHFRLKRKNYNDLVSPRAVPLLLVVLELPAEESEWVDLTPERLIIRKCGWWLSLSGQDPMDAGSRTIVIPSSQRIEGSGLAPLFAQVREVISMNGLTNEVTLARTVGLRAVHAYLRTNGWVRADSACRDTADVYLWPEDNREAAIVPASEGYADFGTRIYQIAEQIGRIEGRKRLAVLADLSIAESDLVRVRLANAHADNTVRLTDGAAALKQAKKLLLAAACSADRPQRMYRAGRNKAAGEYLDRVRLGHTEPGSYMINLLSPVAPSLRDQGTLLPEEPFERKVTRKLASGLRAARQAMDRVNRGVADIGEFESRLGEGISANLCQSVARLTAAGKGLEVSVSWAMTRPDLQEAGERVAVAFRPPDVAVLNEAARVLANRQERTDEEVQGYVSRLAREKTDPTGTATIKAFVDGKVASVQAVFDSTDYREITRAHEARLSVSLEGDLYREGQRWHLRNPREVTVIEDEDG